jgi:hypothetical protein
MGVAPFFDRVYGAVGGHLTVSRESLEETLATTTIGLQVGDAMDENAWWIAELSVNLIARLYSRVAISADSELLPRLREIALSINPGIEFIDRAPGSTTICVGNARSEDALYPSASGWVARVRHESPATSGPPNPYAACASATLACAELFRRVFLSARPEPDVAVSLLDYKCATGIDSGVRPHDVGNVWFVGLGAVGNAGLWALGRDKNCSGNIRLIDHEDLTLLNLQRYVLATLADVGKAKTEVGRAALADSPLKFELSKTTVEEFAEINGPEIDTICVSVDNIASRRAAQGLLPRLVVNGWTGDRALGASWHRLNNGSACLACLYHPRGQGPSATEQAAKALGLSNERAAMLWVSRQPLSEDDLQAAARSLGIGVSQLSLWRGKPLGELYTDVVCGAVALDMNGIGRVETVPLAHQSALAGILMIAELVKRTDRDLSALSQNEPLVSWDDILRAVPSIWAKPRSPEPGCICGDADYLAAYEEKWAR